MTRVALLTALVFCGSTAAQAAFINNVTGADMVGMTVTASFQNGPDETAVWAVISTDVSVANDEGFVGGAEGTGWSLQQQGDSQGNVDSLGTVLGEWTLSNSSAPSITSIVIEALVGDIVFDGNVFDSAGKDLTLTEEFTAGSGFGRHFLPDPTTGPVPSLVTYGSQYAAPDLWGSLTLSWLADSELFDGGKTLQFLADTDKSIPAPGTLLLLLIGSLGLAVRKLAGRR